MSQKASERTGERHLEAIQDPRRSEGNHDQPVPAAPRQSIQPRRNMRFDPLAGCHKSSDYFSLDRLNLCRRENRVAHSVEELLVSWNDRGERTAQDNLRVFHEKIRTKSHTTAHRLN